ncbi:hypothetical protein DRE_06961 [Drechslerella stenobrocha 248]|uniref:Uncharacterized protein n=1 Tax=Drechslerella stenobrocha 248 TaxID=1043628 RepID=W7HJT1_9PEZI|nr:hypothetical protein DRE_06961 [Drechslerella stenobrocha 248]
MAKHDSIPEKIMHLKREKPKQEWGVSDSENVIDQLMDLFVKGSEKTLNTNANFDYLAYLFADIARHAKGRRYFIETQAYDSVIPITKLIVFTEHKSLIRRKGVASTLKNSLFDIKSHTVLISDSAVNLLPYLLLPLMGPEEYPDDESLSMPVEVQLLPPDKERESDSSIISTHLESIMLLTTTREARDSLREKQVYSVIREVHLAVEDENVRDICQRLVDVLQRDEADDSARGAGRVEGEVDDNDEIVDLV